MADVTIEARPYRYTSGFTATATVTSYAIQPVTGRPEQSYMAVFNSGAAVLQISFGEDGTPPSSDDYFPLQPGQPLEPSPAFFSKGAVTMYITGTDTFTITR